MSSTWHHGYCDCCEIRPPVECCESEGSPIPCSDGTWNVDIIHNCGIFSHTCGTVAEYFGCTDLVVSYCLGAPFACYEYEGTNLWLVGGAMVQYYGTCSVVLPGPYFIDHTFNLRAVVIHYSNACDDPPQVVYWVDYDISSPSGPIGDDFTGAWGPFGADSLCGPFVGSASVTSDGGCWDATVSWNIT